MPRKVKCAYCGNQDTKENMVYAEKDKKYIHKTICEAKYMDEKAFRQKERGELFKLVEIIKKVHQIEVVPGRFFPYLNDLRNGSVLFGKIKKQYKQGVTYDVIAKTYEYCQDTINWAKNNKDFDGAFVELKYGLAVVKDKLNIVKKKLEQEEMQRVVNEKKKVNYDDYEIEYIKKENDKDISKYL